MHICFITGEYPPYPHGGVGSFIQTLGRALVRSGHRVSVVGIYPKPWAGTSDDEGVRVIRLLGSRFPKAGVLANTVRLRRMIWQLHTEQAIDIVETPELGHAFSADHTPWIKLIRMNGGHRFFSVTAGRKPGPVLSFLEARSFQRADALCAVSNFVAETTRHLLELDNQKIEIIPNPVDTNLFQPRDSIAEEAGLIVFIGTLVEKKGLFQLMQAFPQILSHVPEAQLFVVGRDHKDISTGRSSLERAKEFLTPESARKVTFLSIQPHSEIPLLLARVQVAVYPSHMEAMPVAWLEAMAMGKAIVASRTGPGPEVISDEITGLLCDPHDPGSIAAQVIRLLQDDNLRESLGRAARKRAVEVYSIDVLVRRNIQYYERLIVERASGRKNPES